MNEIEAIKHAPDVVVVHQYQNGRLVATEYRSSLGTAVERHDTATETQAELTENEPEPVASEPKQRRR